MNRSIAAVVVPRLASSEWPRVGLLEAPAPITDCLERRELRAAVGVKRGAQRARDLPRAERAEDGHLGLLRTLPAPLGLFDECVRRRSCAALAVAGVALDRDQDFVLLGDLRRRVDQLEVG